jgi:molybdopterin-guanine dinucleotide biosynthesis protein A
VSSLAVEIEPLCTVNPLRLYHRHMSAISAFILAGGKSSRMGTEKAFLDWAGGPLLMHMLVLATQVAGQVKIVGDRAKFAAFAPLVEDTYPGCGPLGGIHAALMNSDAELNLILGVDLPFLDAALLNYLVSQAEDSRAVATVPFAAGHYQTLCSIYRKEFSATAEQALQAGKYKIDALFPKVSLRLVDEKELAGAGFNITAFRNLNTPDEWERAKRELGSRTQHL